MQWVHAHPGEQQRVLSLEEALRPHAARAAALGRVHFQRCDLRCPVIGSGQCFGIAGNRQHHRSGRGEQAIVAFLIGPGDLAGLNRVERDHMAAFGQPDARHTARGTPLRPDIARFVREQRGVG